jgi:hypothetical protein
MAAPAPIDLRTELQALAGLRAEGIVSVYLNTRWADEHQRERVRVFLKGELRRARETAGAVLARDLEWIAAQGEAIVSQVAGAGVHGVALFACEPLGLRKVIPLRTPFEDAFLVADRPRLGPLAASLGQARSALVIFVTSGSARLIPLEAGGVGQEVRLSHEIQGRHRRGGWAQLAQSRYQRHLAAQREYHYDAVANAVATLTAWRYFERLVLMGPARSVAALRRCLPGDLKARVAGTAPGADHEAASVLAARADEVLAAEAGAPDRGAARLAARTGRRVAAGSSVRVDASTRGR